MKSPIHIFASGCFDLVGLVRPSFGCMQIISNISNILLLCTKNVVFKKNFYRTLQLFRPQRSYCTQFALTLSYQVFHYQVLYDQLMWTKNFRLFILIWNRFIILMHDFRKISDRQIYHRQPYIQSEPKFGNSFGSLV